MVKKIQKLKKREKVENPTSDATDAIEQKTVASEDSSSKVMAEKFSNISVESAKTDGMVKITNMTMGRIDVRGTNELSYVSLFPGETKDITRKLYRDILCNEMTRIWLDIGVLRTDVRPDDVALKEATSTPEVPDSLKVGVWGTKEAREDLSRRVVGTVTV